MPDLLAAAQRWGHMSVHLHESALTVVSKSSVQHALLHFRASRGLILGACPFKAISSQDWLKVSDKSEAQGRADTMRAALFHIGRKLDIAISDTHLNEDSLPGPSFRFETTQIL